MNILFISHLSGASFAGPTYSVPSQIAAQSKVDNVFWYNAVKKCEQKWEEIPYYHDLLEFPKEKISSLPEPFDKPDLVVVEQFYNMAKSPLLFELQYKKLPYIIIPRGELTKQGQNRKKIKKVIFNYLLFNRFAKRAVAIHFLTKQEKEDSGNKWNNKSIIIPNGIEEPSVKKRTFLEEGIKGVSIGRIEPYQKGLDILIDVCSILQEELRKNNFSIKVYGPDVDGSISYLKDNIAEKGIIDIVNICNPVYGVEKEKVLLESDLFVMLSRFEGHPMALIEALSYGLPCLVTTGSNMRYEVDNTNSGWTADVNYESICTAIKKMLYDKSDFEKKGNNAFNLSKAYKWDNIARITHDKYIEIM